MLVARELPGDVFNALRLREGYTSSLVVFAGLIGLSDDTLRRLEAVRWGTTPDEWSRPVDLRDVELLQKAGFTQPGDEWEARFRKAFVWQQLVLRYGRKLYEQGGEAEVFLEPVSEGHVVAIITSVVQIALSRRSDASMHSAQALPEVSFEVATAEILFRLAATGLLRPAGTEGNSPGKGHEEVTRSVLYGGQAGLSTPISYIRTLRLVYDWTQELVDEALANDPGSDGIAPE